MNIEQRIRYMEKAVGLADTILVPVLMIGVDPPAGGHPPFPEPIEEWLTTKQAVEEAVRSAQPCVFIAAPDVEAAARRADGRATTPTGSE